MTFGATIASSVDGDHEPSGEAVAIVQSDHGNRPLFLSGIVAGHLLVGLTNVRSTPTSVAGYTPSPAGDLAQSNGDRCLAFYKTADGTETSFSHGAAEWGASWYEVSGTPTGAVRGNTSATGTGSVATTPGINVVEGDVAFLICTIGEGGVFDSQNHNNEWTGGGGWIEDRDAEVPDGHPSAFCGHQIITADGVLAGLATFAGGSNPWAAQLLVFVGSGIAFESMATGWGT